jgi:hypothetical protein
MRINLAPRGAIENQQDVQHGECDTERHNSTDYPEYDTWRGMIARCHDPKHNTYPLYGARGIVVCDRWRASFLDFIADVGRRPGGRLPSGRPEFSLDRIDNDGNYEPGNVRWTTWAVQSKNKKPIDLVARIVRRPAKIGPRQLDVFNEIERLCVAGERATVRAVASAIALSESRTYDVFQLLAKAGVIELDGIRRTALRRSIDVMCRDAPIGGAVLVTPDGFQFIQLEKAS